MRNYNLSIEGNGSETFTVPDHYTSLYASYTTNGSALVEVASDNGVFIPVSGNGAGQRTTVTASGTEERYLAADNYYLQFTGIGDGAFRLTFEERP
jgi:hypothetical protein